MQQKITHGREEFLPGATAIVRAAPARVNLIGEHTDYTGGLVLPMAIPFHSVATLHAAADDRYQFTSERFGESLSVRASDDLERSGTWSDYAVGVLQQLRLVGIHPAPFSLHFRGDVPLGSGLSSSASIEVATAMALLAHAAATLSVKEIARLCQRAENDFVQSPCGIMDQFVVTAAEAGHALMLQTRNLEYELLPMNVGSMAETRVVIANSTVKHSIAGGDYGLRRRQVEEGQQALRDRFKEVRDLGDATLAQLQACSDQVSRESFLRCRHIISENARVLAAKSAMLAGDPDALGALMNASHASQRDDFECSCEEIDYLVSKAQSHPGCYGARLTGGGFGGCTVNLVAAEQASSFASFLQSAYRERFSLDAPVFICEAVDGANQLIELSEAKGSE